jgi:hypothetical protein
MIFLWEKRSRQVKLKNNRYIFPAFRKIWNPWYVVSLQASTVCYRDSYACYCNYLQLRIHKIIAILKHKTIMIPNHTIIFA